MALYNNGFPVGYQQMQQPIYQQPVYQMQPQAQMQGQQYQQQYQQQAPQQYPATSSGFVRVANENEARMYPVAPGNSVTFIDENAPYCYTKTVDRSQLDRPKFEKYRLVKEDDAPPIQAMTPAPIHDYALKEDVTALYNQIAAIRAELDAMAKKPTPKPKKEATENE